MTHTKDCLFRFTPNSIPNSECGCSPEKPVEECEKCGDNCSWCVESDCCLEKHPRQKKAEPQENKANWEKKLNGLIAAYSGTASRKNYKAFFELLTQTILSERKAERKEAVSETLHEIADIVAGYRKKLNSHGATNFGDLTKAIQDYSDKKLESKKE